MTTMFSNWSLPDLRIIREAYEDYRAKKCEEITAFRKNLFSEGQEKQPDPQEAIPIITAYKRCIEVLKVINQKIKDYEENDHS